MHSEPSGVLCQIGWFQTTQADDAGQHMIDKMVKHCCVTACLKSWLVFVLWEHIRMAKGSSFQCLKMSELKERGMQSVKYSTVYRLKI